MNLSQRTLTTLAELITGDGPRGSNDLFGGAVSRKDDGQSPWSMGFRPPANHSREWIVISYTCARVCALCHTPAGH